MIGTNRDLAEMRETVDDELERLSDLSRMLLDRVSARYLASEIARLWREQIALSAALVNRRQEAVRPVGSFARWASGAGALDKVLQRRFPRFVSGDCAAPIAFAVAANVRKGDA